MEFDVLIAGAGPAGCATAISLGDFAPELCVGLAGARPAKQWPVGETLPPRIRPLLEHLGLWSTFAMDRHCPSHRVISAWGAPDLASNEFLFETHQVGWRIDRPRFDAMMLAGGASRATCFAARVEASAYDSGRWRIRLDDGTEHGARFVVDATGRGNVVARNHGGLSETCDRLVASIMRFEQRHDDAAGLLIETFRGGWWYTAALPDNHRVAVCLSDADLVRSLGIETTDGWMKALGETRHIRSALRGSRSLGAPTLRPAGSRRMTGNATLPLLCVGDAASCFDPVSGQGIFKALRHGIFASYSIADTLCRGSRVATAHFRAFSEQEFASYRDKLGGYYALERRWPDHPFWQRRVGDRVAVSLNV